MFVEKFVTSSRDHTTQGAYFTSTLLCRIGYGPLVVQQSISYVAACFSFRLILYFVNFMQAWNGIQAVQPWTQEP